MLFFLTTLHAQKSIQDVSRIWIGWLNQTKLTDKWSLYLDAHFRTADHLIDGHSFNIYDAGISYFIRPQVKLTAAYGYIHEFPAAGHKLISRPEHRPWQQLQWNTRYGKQRMMQWIRVEERFRRKVSNDSVLGSGYNFNWRLRHLLLYEVPLSKHAFEPGTFAWVISNEVFLNMGHEVVNNIFDQNRFFTGLRLQVNRHDYVQIGYLNLFQPTSTPGEYKDQHVLRMYYYQQLDWSKHQPLAKKSS